MSILKIELTKEDLNRVERQQGLNILGHVEQAKQMMSQGLTFFSAHSGTVSFEKADAEIKKVDRSGVPLRSLVQDVKPELDL